MTMQLNTQEIEFGYYPRDISLKAGDIEVKTLSGLEEKIKIVENGDTIDNNWIYSPPQETHDLGVGIIERPYSARVFGLKKTHLIRHAKAENEKHLVFLVWVLSFFLGMRVTTEKRGYLDATPIRPGSLVDFVLPSGCLSKALTLSDEFWLANHTNQKRTDRFIAAVHALFISQYPQSLQYEKFIFLYTALDACYKMASIFHPSLRGCIHKDRIHRMCEKFEMETPDWASNSQEGVASIRNYTLHEGLFMDAPLGFAVHNGEGGNLILEMRALVCRFLVALIAPAGASSYYVRSTISSRQRTRLEL